MGSLSPSTSSLSPSTAAPSLAGLLEPIAADLQRVETVLAEQVAGFDPGVHEYVGYVLSGSGKRLRPSLALLAGGATGGNDDGHITLGVIVELIHIATLVHDDVLDEADLRHGLPTTNARWGNETSVLLGDCLFAHALKLAAGYPTTEVCQRVSHATNVVCSGEILQTRRRFDLDLRVGEYLDIIRMKTGALFGVSCELGAYLNGAERQVVESLFQFGEHLGIAYQIFDDCVDILGHERSAGKSLGTDVKKGKLTLPYLLSLAGAEPGRRRELGDMIFRDTPADRQELHRLVLGNGVLTESLATIDTYVAQARAALACLGEQVHAQALSELLDFLSGQSRRLIAAA